MPTASSATAIAGFCVRPSCGKSYVVMGLAAKETGTCSKACSRRLKKPAKRRRAETRYDQEARWQVCPKPTKRFYRNIAAAEAAAATMLKLVGVAMRPYLCECRRWHLLTPRRRRSALPGELIVVDEVPPPRPATTAPGSPPPDFED